MWSEGETHCKSEGMELVSIETEAENSQIVAFLLEHQSSKLQTSSWFYGLDHILGQQVTLGISLHLLCTEEANGIGQPLINQ
jgi:hypothetical protein